VSLIATFITSKNYKERYFNLKLNYIEIDKLYIELKDLSNSKEIDGDEVKKIYEKYSNLLKYVENQSNYDYLTVMSSIEEEKKKLTKKQLRLLGWYKVSRVGSSILFYISPPIIVFILIKCF
jgi:hypothetical protein